MNEIYSGYEIELNKEENKAHKGKMLKIEGNSYQETRDRVDGTLVSGEFINITDAQDLQIRSFNIKGKGEQETREGYNHFDAGNLKLTNTTQMSQSWENDVLTVTSAGLPFALASQNITDLVKNNPGQSLTFDFEDITFTQLDKTKSSPIQMNIYFSDGTANQYWGLVNYQSNKFPYTIPDDTSNISSVLICVYSWNGTGDDSEFTTTVTKPMLYLGTESKPYERYGKTPSMEFESPIKSVGDNIQLFDIKTITKNMFTDSTTGELKTSSVSSSSDYIKIKANENYVLSYEYETLQNTSNRGMAFYDENKTYLSGINYKSSDKETTIISEQNGYLRFCYDNNCTNIKFTQGTSTGPYSPYGMGSVEIEHCNKNFLKVLNKTATTQNGITITPNEDGTYTANGTSTGIVSYRITTEEGVNSFVQPLPAGKYIASCENTAYATHFLQFVMKDDVSGESWHNTSPTKEFETNGGTYQALIYIRSGVTLDNFVFKPMLRLASVEDGTYIEKQSKTSVIYTQQPFRSVKDVEDTFAKKMGKWKEEHKINHLVFNGTENWVLQTVKELTNVYKHYDTKIYPIERTALLSNYFIDKVTGDNEGIIIQEQQCYLAINKETAPTAEDFKAKLVELYNAGKPLYIDYPLETPTLIDCTEEQIEQLDYFYEEAKTYEGVNNVYSIDEVKPTITFRYNCLPALPSVEEKSEVESVGNNKQLFDKNTVTDGIFILLANGKEYKNDVWSQSDFIQVKQKGIYSAYNSESINNSGWIEVSEYDEEKKWIKSKQHGSKGDKRTTFTLGRKTFYIRLGYRNDVGLIDLKLSEGEKITTYSPFGQGSLKITHLNRNLVDMNKIEWRTNTNGTYEYISNNEIKVNAKSGTYSGIYTKEIKVQDFRKPVVISFEMKADQNCKVYVGTAGVDRKTIELTPEYKRFTLKDIGKNSTGAIVFYGLNLPTDLSFYIKNLMISYEEFEFKPHQSEEFLLPIQEPFRQEGSYKDLFVKDNEKWYEHHNIFKWIFDGTENWYTVTNGKGIDCYVLALGSSQLARTLDIKSNMLKQTDDIWNIAERKDVVKISSGLNGINILMKGITTLEDFKGTLATLYEEGNPLYVEYVLKTPKLIPCTPQQSTILDQLENIQLYDGVNYIYTTDGIQPLLTLELYNMIEDYDLYVSNDGYFGIPGTDIKFLVNFYESNLPTMPEAVEASVRAAGRNGDYVLNTTYEPLPFEIVCFTEDNLTPTQKKEIESKVNRFLNSIKNRTKKIAFEKGEKFYNVKYNGLLTTTNYPAHLKFSIPLKSSESFGKDAYQKVLSGNSTEVSDTVEEVGALITINGPATLPIIALNDYSMEYSTSILEGARIEIDTAKSTATHINSDGVKTNVMRYYNHQFPKIQPGENTLKVLSGVDDENNVTVKWNDLKL